MWSPDRKLWRWAAALPGLLGLAAALWLVSGSAPTLAQLRATTPATSGMLLDRHGEPLDSVRLDFGVRRWPWVPLDQVSPALPQALIEAEDRRFAEHGGVDWRALLAASRDALRGRPRGASTLTMQLATLIERQRGGAAGWAVWRKLQQIRLALALERHWSKAQILEAYLNLLPFRGELQGVGAAAAVLAGKAPAGLSVDESRILAALLPSPSAPATTVAARACRRLAQQAAEAACAQLQATAQRLLGQAERAGATGQAPQVARLLLRPDQPTVRSSLDARVQRVAREALQQQLQGLATRNVRDGAALVIDNASGEVLAYVGSAGPHSRSPQVDGVRARRQAGSTLKPFLYGLALEQRYLTAASLLDDTPLTLDTRAGVYVPRDYDHDFKGPVSLRTALAGSLNVPAVRTLVLVGVEAFHQRLTDLGYQGLGQDGAWHGFALALGSADVSLWEQAQAYRTLARGGVTGALRLAPATDATVQADSPAASRQLLQPEATWIIGDILADKAARAVTFGLDNALATRRWSAVKTGTSSDMRDNWCIGWSPRYTVAVWVGNFEGDPMRNVSGVSGAAPAWRQIMDALADDSSAPAPPPSLRQQVVRFAGGLEPPRGEWFLRGTTPAGATVARVAESARRPTLAYPTDGLLVALDPDIPLAAQRLPLRVLGLQPGVRLLLNDTVLPLGGEITLWTPVRGSHRLRLLATDGSLIEHVQFTVR